jgi:hypothetical protein
MSMAPLPRTVAGIICGERREFPVQVNLPSPENERVP